VNEIQFVDQTTRDAQQSLWGFMMPTEMMLPIAPVMDQVGYKAIGVVGARGAVMARRYLKENIFERMRRLSEKIVKTPLRSSFTSWSAFGFDVEPIAALELWIRTAFASGIRSFWICDYQTRKLEDRLSYLIPIAKSEGAEIVVSLMYTLSPVHTDELFARKTRAISALGGVDAIHVEDAGGVLTPERTKTLIPAIQQEAEGLPIEIHSHCNAGLAPMCYTESLQAGITTFHTAVLPLANGHSLPSTENTIENARHLGYAAGIDEEALKTVSDYFAKEIEKRGMATGVPVEYDYFQYRHQVPGGMMGTLRKQLAEVGMEDRMEEVLEEVGVVRKDLGYPVMATPYSQFVGAQAVFNVTSGERYKIIPDEVIRYALEYYGELDGPLDPNLKDRILSLPKAKQFINKEPPEITVDELRKLEPGLSDEELLLQLATPEGEFRNKLKALYGRA
jgi:oxaloacetate decarboxylase alpha subunit